MVMILLALAGSILVGNDFHFGSLPFYLSKPLSRWHYVAGKCLAVAVFVNLMTTVPALVLFVQYGLLDSWDYFLRDGWVLARMNWGDSQVSVRTPNPLLLGIIAYGLSLTRVPEPASGGDGELAAADRAADHGLDDAVLFFPASGHGVGGRLALRSTLAADRSLERHLSGREALAWGWRVESFRSPHAAGRS